MLRVAITLVAALLLPFSADAQSGSLRLSRVEERIREFVKSHEAEQIALLNYASSHSREERVNLKSLVPSTERAAILIYRLTGPR